jgi:hypothetical protein
MSFFMDALRPFAKRARHNADYKDPEAVDATDSMRTVSERKKILATTPFSCRQRVHIDPD